MSSSQLPSPASFANTTLLYSSHISDWAIYFDPSQPEICQYRIQQFEARGGANSQGTALYEINSLGDNKWQILIQKISPNTINAYNFKNPEFDHTDTFDFKIIFWTHSFNLQSLDGQPVIAATGNVYDEQGTPMWTDNERSMDLIFQRGKNFQGISEHPGFSEESFANTTLLYASRMSKWGIYFDLNESGKCQYWGQPFEGCEGTETQGVGFYTIDFLDEEQWQISIQGIDPQETDSNSPDSFGFKIIFWIDYFNSQAFDHEMVIIATGNVYDDRGTPMWPGGERVMDLVFRRGKSLLEDG